MAMHDNFEIIPFLNRTLESRRSGRAHIVSDGVEWCLDIDEGKLLFAAHSLQYLNTLETTLPSLGYEAVLPVYWRLTQLDIYKRQIDHIGLESLNWTSKIVGALIQYNVLKIEQAEKILAKLAEDAAESLLGLEHATVTWHPLPKELWHATTRGDELTSLINHLSRIRQLWQPLCDRICSPHQRPYCASLEVLYQPIPQGVLSQQMLASLARLMQGGSIRQLAHALKQDEIKLAQLLYPYIKHRAIKLWPPLQPLDRLPWLPAKQQQPPSADDAAGKKSDDTTSDVAAPAPSDNTTAHTQPAHDLNSSRVTQTDIQTKVSTKPTPSSLSIPRPRHLIVCIDDSQAMLEKIESYLDPTYFELDTIIDPVKSVSKICTRKPSLVLMDISMPSINGNSLCSILKRSYMFKDVPIIMISGNVSALDKAKSQVSGAAGYLEKPFSKEQLLGLIESYLKLNVDELRQYSS